MKIAITGGTGFIGRHVAQDLVSRGHDVVVIARGQYTRNSQPIEGAAFFTLDANDTDRLTQAFQGCDAVMTAWRSFIRASRLRVLNSAA